MYIGLMISGRQTDVHTVEPLVLEPSAFEFAIVIVIYLHSINPDVYCEATKTQITRH